MCQKLLMTALRISVGVLALGLSAPAFAAGFDQNLALQGVSFHVTCPNQGSINAFRIEPQGLK